MDEPQIVPLSGNTARQYIDACAAFRALDQARKDAGAVRGTMYWRKQGGNEYLIRQTGGNRQSSLGPRSEETEGIYQNFVQRKATTEARLRRLETTVAEHERMNRALRVGRAPRMLVSILNSLEIQIDIIRREAKEGDDHPLPLTERRGEEFFAVQAVRAGRLLSAKPFATIIVDDMGRMANMTTIAPVDFARFKEWMSAPESRDMIKRRRDALQAVLVHQLVMEFLPQWKEPAVRPTDDTSASDIDTQVAPRPSKPRRPRG